MNNLVQDKLKSLDDTCRIYGAVRRYVNFFGISKSITKKGLIQFIISTDIEDDFLEINNRIDKIIEILLQAEVLKHGETSHEYDIVRELPTDNFFD